jgi:uncharacterized protein YhbP (UPF0306 family)
VLTLERYDKWEDRVSYAYDDFKTVGIMIKKGTEDLITAENYKDYEVSDGDDTKWFEVRLSEVKRYTNSCSLSSWLQYVKNAEERGVVYK